MGVGPGAGAARKQAVGAEESLKKFAKHRREAEK